MMNLKRIVAEATIAGALGFTALGLGAGVANAAPVSPDIAGIPWQQDEGHGDHGDGGDHRDWGPPCPWCWVPPAWEWVPPPPPPPWEW
jgi:hypothetical protein